MAYADGSDTVLLKGPHRIDVEIDGVVYDGIAAAVTATMKDVAGDTVTSFSDAVDIWAKNDSNIPVLVSTDGDYYSEYIQADMSSGTLSQNLYFDVTGTEDYITIYAQTSSELEGYKPFGVDQADTALAAIIFTTTPSSVERGEDFTLALRMEDGAGNPITTITTSATLSLSGDASDVLNTTNISIVDGVWSSSTMQINGGDGIDASTITASADDYTSGTTDFTTVDTSQAYHIVVTASPYPGEDDEAVTFKNDYPDGFDNYYSQNGGSSWTESPSGYHLTYKLSKNGVLLEDTGYSGTYYHAVGKYGGNSSAAAQVFDTTHGDLTGATILIQLMLESRWFLDGSINVKVEFRSGAVIGGGELLGSDTVTFTPSSTTGIYYDWTINT